MSRRVDEVAEELLGTCKDLDTAIMPEEYLSAAFLSELDERVVLCATCGWWVEVHEVDEEENCEDCRT